MNLTLPADRASKLSWQPEGPLCRRRRPQHRPGHIDALLDFFGGGYVAIAAAVAELADLVARGELEVPIAGVFALDDVRDAYRQLECATPAASGAATVSDGGIAGCTNRFGRVGDPTTVQPFSRPTALSLENWRGRRDSNPRPLP